jgi:hypothetical protein
MHRKYGDIEAKFLFTNESKIKVKGSVLVEKDFEFLAAHINTIFKCSLQKHLRQSKNLLKKLKMEWRHPS